jgi:RNA polymerase sigma factor (sigma-70 family)
VCPVDAAIRRELSSLVRDALRQLPDDDRLVLRLRFHQHLSFQDIGSALAISPAAAMKRVQRALQKAAPVLEELPIDPSVAW